ncbi:MAG: aminotransferase class V-fold PLP-dependent enzyme [Cellvibrionaceae bacterium]
MNKSNILRKSLSQKKISQVVGCGNAIDAKYAEKHGFDAVWASGLCISAAAGLPDAGIITMTENLKVVSEINRATYLPIIADCDTGFGDVDNTIHMVKEYRRAGIAAVCIEDKVFPKTNSFTGNHKQVTINEFSTKIKAAKAYSSDGEILIFARIESLISGAGMSDAISRAEAYAQSGADAILIHSKKHDPEEIVNFCNIWTRKNIDIPIIVVPTTYYKVKKEELENIGVAMVIYANQGLRASIKAVDETFSRIKNDNSTESIEKDIGSLSELLSISGTDSLQRNNVSEKKCKTSSWSKAYTLLNPGPVNVHPEVTQALCGPDMCHRESEFFDLLNDTRNKLVKVCNGGQDSTAVILTGSGTSALESVISSVIPDQGKVLLINNGTYGERIANILSTYNIDFENLDFGIGNIVDLEKVQNILEKRNDFYAIAMVHHETSSGILNPLHDVGSLAKKYNIELIVDAISSIGVEDINIERDNVTWCIGSSNKCIEGTPGLSFICADKNSFNRIANQSPRNFYLNLGRHYVSQYYEKVPLFTPSVQAFYSLNKALDILLKESVLGRYDRYLNHAKRLRNSLKNLDFELIASEKDMSCVTTIFKMKDNVSYDDFHYYMKSCGFIIYKADSRLGNVFRISSMGQVSSSDIDVFLFYAENFIANTKNFIKEVV